MTGTFVSEKQSDQKQSDEGQRTLKPCTVLIVGLGLMGGSLARALKLSKACAQVLGYARRAQTLVDARHAQVIDEGYTELQAAVRKASHALSSEKARCGTNTAWLSRSQK